MLNGEMTPPGPTSHTGNDANLTAGVGATDAVATLATEPEYARGRPWWPPTRDAWCVLATMRFNTYTSPTFTIWRYSNGSTLPPSSAMVAPTGYRAMDMTAASLLSLGVAT